MCRFAFYLGPSQEVADLVTRPRNSLLHQSYRSRLRREPLNGDGFGIAWYVDGFEEPALFKEVRPAWNSMNLRHLARVTRTRCLLAHVRAATPGLPVHQFNCHPFVSGRFAFMHNGLLPRFDRMRRRMLLELDDDEVAAIQGSTDSEHLFALWLRLHEAADPELPPLERMTASTLALVERAEALRREVDTADPCIINLLVSDGSRAVATRYASPGHEPETLFVHTGRRYVCEEGACRMVALDGPESLATIVASEPLSEDPGWTEVPVNHLVTVDAGRAVEVHPIPEPAA